jgi:GT2 family glycosyltransferase
MEFIARNGAISTAIIPEPVQPVGTPEVSVIVVNWNRRELLRACLESLSQQAGAKFETILVDNGSADGSLEMAGREFGARPELGLRVIANSENRGFCAANNQGIAAARGSLVALLNNDAEASPGWLAALRTAILTADDIGMAASKILVWEDPSRIDKAGHLMYPDGQNRGRGSGETDRGQYDVPAETLWPDGCAGMYKRAMLDEVGGFDEDFFAYGDDAELGLRARIAGWRCLYTPAAVVRHHRGATLGLDSARRLELIERNRVLLAAKLFPWSLLWLNGPYYLARLTAGVWAAMRGRGETAHYLGMGGKLRAATALVKGDLAALRMLPRILRKRREMRRIRKLTPRQVRELLLRHRIPLRTLSEGAA